ncbi:hypothetical protein [Amycolatopsis dendrobii]|uniref:Uncharacterized protein n=1 Tax=Amycolatopsis dendrobii TaxID=2760662 RepID=A0A7W3VVH9_9PSEU|nr:hypothetical protein [Amycolatopsis dendrobii]MBB1153999.1 hypothetical protein [Amycolatopsis dendrobii]
MAAVFVRARCDETGAVAALPKPALEAGMCPGWAEADGPVPDKPKPAAFAPPTGADESTTDTADSSAGTEQSADAPSAKKKE